MILKKTIIPKSFDYMYSGEGYIMKREYGESPSGGLFRGRWVLRDNNNNIIDFDPYRNNIAERNNIELIQVV